MRAAARGSGSQALLALPLFLWMMTFLLVPLLLVALYSVFRRGSYGDVVFELNLGNYARLLDPLYLSIYAASLKMASSVTAVCLALGLPFALVMARAPVAARTPLMVGLMVPFLSNFVVRAYAIKILLSNEGPVAALLAAVGLFATPPSLTDSPLAVWFGMLTNYLPFMVLPIYVALERFDFTLIEAAYDLGATDRAALTRVLLPQIRAGILSGCLLVFVPALGEFMIPDMLGGARTMLLGNLITEQFLKARDWPFGAALVMLLVALMAVGFVWQQRWESHRER